MTLPKAGNHYSSFAGNLVMLEVALLGRHFDFLNRSPAHPIILQNANNLFNISFIFQPKILLVLRSNVTRCTLNPL